MYEEAGVMKCLTQYADKIFRSWFGMLIDEHKLLKMQEMKNHNDANDIMITNKLN